MQVDYLNVETITKALSIAGAAFTAAYRLKDVRPRRRSTLKADLELLRIASAQGIAHDDLAQHVRSELRSLYKPTRREGKLRRLVVATAGVVWLAAFLAWTVYLCRDGFTPWALLTGYFALVGLGIAVSGAETGRVGLGSDSRVPAAGTAPIYPWGRPYGAPHDAAVPG